MIVSEIMANSCSKTWCHLYMAYYLTYLLPLVFLVDLINNNFIISGSRKKILKIPQINGKTFLYPPSPTLTQMEDIPDSMICSLDTTSSDCDYYLKGFCECLQILNVPYNKSVDIILIDQGLDSFRSFFPLKKKNRIKKNCF